MYVLINRSEPTGGPARYRRREKTMTPRGFCATTRHHGVGEAPGQVEMSPTSLPGLLNQPGALESVKKTNVLQPLGVSAKTLVNHLTVPSSLLRVLLYSRWEFSCSVHGSINCPCVHAFRSSLNAQGPRDNYRNTYV